MLSFILKRFTKNKLKTSNDSHNLKFIKLTVYRKYIIGKERFFLSKVVKRNDHRAIYVAVLKANQNLKKEARDLASSAGKLCQPITIGFRLAPDWLK